jgi:hypothetical protein
LLTGGLNRSRFASIQSSTLIGGRTLVVVPVPTDCDGERVEVLMTERICGEAERQPRASSTTIAHPVILSLSKDL